MLEIARCPACDQELPIREFWEATRAIPGWLGLRQKTGLECPSCFANLQASQVRSVIAATLVAGLLISVSLEFRDFINVNFPPLGIVCVFVFAWLITGAYTSRRLVRFREVPAETPLFYPLGRRPERERMLAERAARREQRELATGSTVSADAWACGKCGETSPRELKNCWKCDANFSN